SALLAALQTYAGTIKAGTSERVSIDARVSAYTERFERNVIEAGIRAGTKTNEDLLAFDRSKLAGLNTSSEEYLQRLNAINSTQNEIFNDLQDEQQEKWDKGLITTAQLLNWYKGLRDDLLADNPDLAENVTNAVDQLELRAVDERDSRMMSDYSSGKVAPGDFIVYAQAARGRYEKGTSQFREWDERLDEAKDRAIEDSILYRYDLSQRYAQLEKFVKDHGKAPTGGVSTSTSKRTVWNGERWVTRTSTTNTPYGPSPSEQKAWAKLQVEVNDAKREMAQIAKKMDRQAGGWVSTDDAIGYYQKMKNRYAPGSSEWYAVQAKLDGLNSQKHAEAVMAKQGIRISYPRVSSERRELGSGGSGVWGPAKGGGRGGDGKDRKDGKGDRRRDAAGGDDDIDVDTFMRALAKVESGGRYDAVNKSSGAYGKYQIMPANWPGWAQKFLGDKNAKPTPENQEAVARAKLKALHRWLGDWRAVAHWWLTGGSDKQGHRDPSTWSSSSKAYVDKVFGKLGKGPTSRVVATGGGGARQFYSGAGAGGGQYAASPMRSGGGGATLSAGGRDGGGRGDRQGKGKGDGGGRADEEDRGRLRNPLNFPRGYDGRQFEDFYSAFLDAWQSGEDTFVDYGRGRPVAYFIPVDPDNRIDLMEELDERRVGYYIEKSRAYLNPNGSPT
ncbi:MAG TPA: transglycosylase family protein, partial [Solirubrobacterales bacterium]